MALNRIHRQGFTERVTFAQKDEGRKKGVSHTAIWGHGFQAESMGTKALRQEHD